MRARVLIGWNLRRLRVAKGLSQEAAGLIAGCEPSYFGRLERGRENPTVETLEVIAAALDAHVSALFEVPEDGALPPAPMRPGRKPKA